MRSINQSTRYRSTKHRSMYAGQKNDVALQQFLASLVFLFLLYEIQIKYIRLIDRCGQMRCSLHGEIFFFTQSEERGASIEEKQHWRELFDWFFRMNYARIFTLVQLIASVTAVLQSFYPCQYVDSNKNRLKCDLCQCSSNPATDAVSNLCSFQSTRTCSGQLSDPLEPFLINDSFPPKTELELDHFSDGAVRLLFEQPHFCSTWNFSRLTFVHLKSNLSFPSLPHCLATIESLLLINSFLTSPLLVLPDHLSTLILLNTTWNTARINFTSIETLHLSSVRSLGKPLELHSLSSLIHLTITHIANYVLRGSFPHLSYLNLAQTNLTDQRWNQILSNIQVPDLTTLMLSGNQLTVVTNRFPSTVRYLDLSVNQIKALDYYSFKSLYSLNVLNLSSNSPLEIQQETFTRIPYLEVLDLSFCSPSLDFEELFQPLQKLRHLNISANQLDTFPLLPVPYDAHTIDSYDQQLPVLHVDLSKNDFAQLNAEMFLSSSTQDKYTLEIKIQSNQVKTLKLTSAFFNETKRRGPFIELDLTDNPLQCDCHLYESVLNVFKYDPTYQKQSLFQGEWCREEKRRSIWIPVLGSPPFYPYVVQNAPSTALRSWKDGQQPGLSTSLVKQARLKLLHLSNLKCTDMMEPSITRSLVDLHSFDSFCFYNIACPPTCPCCSSPKSCFCQWQCPSVCSCQHSSDFIVNHVNCSSRQLPEIPRDIPSSTTHLDLNHNRIKALKNDLVHLTHLKDLSLAHNRLESLTDEQFSMLTHLERLDLSANMIETISSMAFSNLHQLQRLHLHGNPWRPHFYNNQNEFQSNVRLALLSYASGSTCNRSSLGTALSHKDCCQVSTDPSCQPVLSSNRTELKLANALLAYRNQTSSTVLIGWFDRKYRAYSLVGISICLLLCICCILLYLHQRRRSLLAKSPFLSKNDMGKKTNHYDKPLISSRRESTWFLFLCEHKTADGLI